MKIFVGHGAYKGANHLKVHGTTHAAVMDLIRRGVDRNEARAKVTAAVSRPYGWEVLSVRRGAEVIEVTRRDDC